MLKRMAGRSRSPGLREGRAGPGTLSPPGAAGGFRAPDSDTGQMILLPKGEATGRTRARTVWPPPAERAGSKRNGPGTAPRRCRAAQRPSQADAIDHDNVRENGYMNSKLKRLIALLCTIMMLFSSVPMDARSP